jgi:hypothetical protein
VFKVWGPKTFSKLGPFGHNPQKLVIRYQGNFFDMMCYGRLENLGCILYFHALKQKVCVKASQWDENELVKLNSR